MKLIILGSGPAGYSAAFEAARRGMDVTLVEKGRIGGTCLNCGCIPTKSMRASADALLIARRLPEYGISDCENAVVDAPALQNRKQKIISTLAGGLEKSCRNLGVRYIEGTAEIRAPRTVLVNGELLESDAILISTGSDALDVPGLPVDHQFVLDSSDALDLMAIPPSIIIVGGGVIGCELACIFHDFGSAVTIVEGQDRLLPMPGIDQETSAFLAREMKKRKIRVFTGRTLANVQPENGHVTADVAASQFVQQSGAVQPQPVTADRILVTIGRKPCAPAMSEIGVRTARGGWIETDEYLETSVPGIYAAGDVLGPSHIMLAHVAAMEGIRVVENLAGKRLAMDYKAVPSAIFTDPELASVGLSEAQARETHARVACGLAQIRELGKAQAMGQLPGFCKIVADADNGQILGVHLAGAHSSDMIAEATLAIAENINVYQLASVIHAHPTLSEIVFEACRAVLRNIAAE